MPLIVFGGGSASSEVEAAYVTLNKPSGYSFRVYGTTVLNGVTEFFYKSVSSSNRQSEFEVLKGSSLFLYSNADIDPSYDSTDGIAFAFSWGGESTGCVFEVTGSGTITIT